MGALAIRSRWPALALLVPSVACAEPPAPAQTTAEGEWLAFDGNLTASVTRLLHLKGSLFLNSNNRFGVGFRGGH
jgi:hypothetical protein